MLMAEVSSNQKAFLTVSEELLRVNNSITVLEKFSRLSNGIDNYIKTSVGKEIPDQALCSQDTQGIAEAMRYLIFPTDYQRLKDKLSRRKLELTDLVNTYLKGGDIVASKLMSEK
jgi:hypothetical protein